LVSDTCPATCCGNANFYSRYTISEASFWSPRRLIVNVTLALIIANMSF
jgi:hypothetical protein